jgi:DNA-binding response OmpR family regulator
MALSQNVMVVDDEAELANLYRESLKKSGFQKVSFTDPLLAVKDFSHNIDKYSLLITDLRMPHLNGIEFANEIRQYNQHVQILLLAAYFDDDRLTSEDFINANFAEVVEKPVSLKVLLSRVGQLCNSSHRT